MHASNAQINQSKKEAFLRTNIAVKLPAWMIEQQPELLPLSAYSPRRKSLAYATPETGSSSAGSAAALRESPVLHRYAPGTIPISPPGTSARDDDEPMAVADPMADRHVDQLDRVTTADKQGQMDLRLAQHVGGPARDGLVQPRVLDKPHDPGTAIAQSSKEVPVVTEPVGMCAREPVDKTPNNALGIREEGPTMVRSPTKTAADIRPVEIGGENQSPKKALFVVKPVAMREEGPSMTKASNNATEALATDEGTAILESSNNTLVAARPISMSEGGPPMTKPPSNAPAVTDTLEIDEGEAALVHSATQPVELLNPGHKERAIIVIDDDEGMHVDKPDSELQTPAQTDDDDAQSANEGYDRTNVFSPGEISVAGQERPHQDDGARDQETPESDMAWERSSERGMGSEQVYHIGATQSKKEEQERRAVPVPNLRAGTPIESSCLSRNASNWQQPVPNVQPTVIVIDDDDEKDQDVEMEFECNNEPALPLDLRASVQFNDEPQISNSSTVTSEPSSTSAASTATSEPSIASTASTPRKKIRLSRFTNLPSTPRPLSKLDRSRWSAPSRAVHRRFSGPMILTPLRITPFPAGLGEVDQSRSHYPLPDFDLSLSTISETPPLPPPLRRRLRRNMEIVEK